MKKLVIIDGKSVFYRGYYAMGGLSLKDGTPTGGVYGFAAIAMEIVKRLTPDKVVVAWDKAGTSIRQRLKIYSDYKAGRTKPPDDFYAQIPLLVELIDALSWEFLECDDYEADDIIGTLAAQAEATGEYETTIVSSDLDMLQIVGEHVKMWRLLKGFSEISEVDIAAVESKYGIKKSQFLDLKALKGDASDHIPGVPGIGEKTAVKLLADYGSLSNIYEHLSEIKGATAKKLADGRSSAFMSLELARIMTDAPVSLSEVRQFNWESERVHAALDKLEFRSLIRKFQLTPTLIPDADLALSVENGSSAPTGGTSVSRPLPDDLLVAADIKQSMHADPAFADQILSGAEFYDLGQGQFLLDPLGSSEIDAPDLAAVYWNQQTAFAKTPELATVLRELDLPLIPVLYKMERRGMQIDPAHFASMATALTSELDSLTSRIYQLVGTEFNLNSPLQLSDILFNTLALPTTGIKKTSRGYSTGASELEKLAETHPIINLIRDYREKSKLLSTYILPLPKLADHNNRIHTTFTQNVTATGRLSSLSPNLQNIPVRTAEGRQIRAGFIAEKGKVLVAADYAQFELRLAAVLAGDEALVADFNAGVDIHAKTAAAVFNLPIDSVSSDQRRAAKVINFGVLYGMSPRGLAVTTGMSFFEAKRFISDYFRVRPEIEQYLQSTLEFARKSGYVQTLFGRRRPTPDVHSRNFIIRAAAERAAMNMPIQGTEADLMKKAMLAVDRALPAGVDLVCQVHDSLIVECDQSLADTVSEILRREMEQVCPELPVKLAVDLKVADNWGEL